MVEEGGEMEDEPRTIAGRGGTIARWPRSRDRNALVYKVHLSMTPSLCLLRCENMRTSCLHKAVLQTRLVPALLDVQTTAATHASGTPSSSPN